MIENIQDITNWATHHAEHRSKPSVLILTVDEAARFASNCPFTLYDPVHMTEKQLTPEETLKMMIAGELSVFTGAGSIKLEMWQGREWNPEDCYKQRLNCYCRTGFKRPEMCPECRDKRHPADTYSRCVCPPKGEKPDFTGYGAGPRLTGKADHLQEDTMKKKKKVIVLGAGLVGADIAIDLSKNYDVTSIDAVDRSAKFTETEVYHRLFPIDPSRIQGLTEGFDLVINALPGNIGHEILREIITAGKNVVDIAFSPESPLQFDELARSNGVTAVVDFGVAPGICGALLGKEYEQYADIKSFKCMVGGLPLHPEPPMNYKAPFSPIDVISEYTRKVTFRRKGSALVMPALTEVEPVYCFKLDRTLEAFNTDGLRTLLWSFPGIPNMVEKTIRYKGHAKHMTFLREVGFFSTKTGITSWSPLYATSQILDKAWKYKEGEKDFTFMLVQIQAIDSDGSEVEIEYELFDEYDDATGTMSMARTTGYACNAVADLILKGDLNDKGIITPEAVGADENRMKSILRYMRQRGVVYKRKETT
jgi:saccharopine dehydrogenase-like NADP-dependent oxidoreductase